MVDERPQDYDDLLRLVATLQKLESREPERRAIREHLLAKLQVHVTAPITVRGGWRQEPGR